jgi:hypothetical protein
VVFLLSIHYLVDGYRQERGGEGGILDTSSTLFGFNCLSGQDLLSWLAWAFASARNPSRPRECAMDPALDVRGGEHGEGEDSLLGLRLARAGVAQWATTFGTGREVRWKGEHAGMVRPCAARRGRQDEDELAEEDGRKDQVQVFTKQDGTMLRDGLCPSSEKERKKGGDDDTISE